MSSKSFSADNLLSIQDRRKTGAAPAEVKINKHRRSVTAAAFFSPRPTRHSAKKVKHT